MTREEFCQKLVECRESEGCGKNELCRKTGFTFNQLQLLERAGNNFSIEKAVQYLGAINLKIRLVNKKSKSVFILQNQDAVKWLVKYRKPDYSQRSLAKAVGCSHITIANIESEKRSISIDLFLRFAEIIGFSIEFAPLL